MSHNLSKTFTGAGVALITPFTANLEVDYDALRKLVNFQIENGTKYLVILGTTGETATLSAQEKQSVIDTVKETANNRVPLVLGIGGNDTQAIVNTTKNQNLEGISALLSVSPYYNKPNQRGIIEHYTRQADSSSVPLILYNVPGRTGSNVGAETTLKLAEHSNILGVKEASGNFLQCMEIIKHAPDNFAVISGDDAFTLPFIAMGMVGVISVIINAYPAKFNSMIDAALANDMVKARKLHYELLDAMNLIFADGSPGGIKEITQALQIGTNAVRLPLYNVNEQVKKLLLATM